MKRSTIFRSTLLCLLAAGSAAEAQEVGRLFTSPAERVVLERVRNSRKLPAGASQSQAAPVAAEAAVEAAKPEPEYIPVEGEQILVVNGIVRRSGSGRETTWVDSVPHTGNGRLQGGAALTSSRDSGKVALTLRSGKSVIVKPGQTVDSVTGRVREAWQPAPKPAPRPEPGKLE
ncbi:MAG: hypothetical protein V4631_03190 [Pseudomonadota bacterium]